MTKSYNEINELMFQTVYDNVEKDSLGLAKVMQETYDTWKKKDDEYVKSLDIKFDHFRFPFTLIPCKRLALGIVII
jgi:hypothetical protein